MGSGGGIKAVKKLHFHNEHDAIVCELGFNRPSWVADSSISNHESYVLNIVLPRVLAEHNVGRISLLGYANGGGAAHCPLHCLLILHLHTNAATAAICLLPMFLCLIAHMHLYTNAAAVEQTVRLSWKGTAASRPCGTGSARCTC